MSEHTHIDIVFDVPPGIPAPRFVEVENADGESISIGKWVNRGSDWALRIPSPQRSDVELAAPAMLEALEALCDRGNARSWGMARAAIAQARGEAE